ncbi:heme-binding protein [Catenulispora subtropica]|uniref:Heme-binding protein n=1 Tax=Catenulispora subtropica TaxID=450798 RepID=A0ABP5DQ88_9ACTN
MNIGHTTADTVIAAARRRAEEAGVKAAFAVVDTGGNLVAFSRMDGAPLITIDTAVGKAHTAVSVGLDTIHLTAAIQPGAPLFGTGLTLAGTRSFVPYGGGVLIRSGDAVIGALGVSGAPASEDDHAIGAAAIDTAVVAA